MEGNEKIASSSPLFHASNLYCSRGRNKLIFLRKINLRNVCANPNIPGSRFKQITGEETKPLLVWKSDYRK